MFNEPTRSEYYPYYMVRSSHRAPYISRPTTLAHIAARDCDRVGTGLPACPPQKLEQVFKTEFWTGSPDVAATPLFRFSSNELYS